MKQIARRRFLLNTLKMGAVLPLVGLPATLLADNKEENTSVKYKPADLPDRMILTVTADPSTSMTVNWRTADIPGIQQMEYAVADAHPDFISRVSRADASSRPFKFEMITAKNHTAAVMDLLPATLYNYRVGSGDNWSEWMQFRTADRNREKASLSFIYLGDAQVGIRPLWSRVIRKAYAACPDAALVIHAGDLVNRANKDDEWGDWFAAGAFIHSSIPALVTPGNHEYTHEDGKPHLSVYWKEQFHLPANGPADELLAGSCYYSDLQGVRFISLNTQMIEEAMTSECITRQIEWLHGILKNNPQQWTCVVMHHPVYSTNNGRNNKHVKKHLKPVFEKYGVDLVLQGHDHAYGRGMGKQTGTMYVVSVSGSKMYKTDAMDWADTISGNVQLYHTININDGVLSFNAWLSTGELLDAFELQKQKGKPNQLINKKV